MNKSLRKERLRRLILKRRRNMPAEEVDGKSSAIYLRLLELKEFREARVIVLYLAKGNEVRTLDIMRRALIMGKMVLAPAVMDSGAMRISQVQNIEDDLTRGAWGILEPKAHFADLSERIKDGVVVLPGIVFDNRGGRIGFGKGYYDRFLKKLPGNVVRVGLCYGFQLEKEPLPLTQYDMSVDVIVTEKKIITC